MIIHKCDLCKKKSNELDTMILYKKSFNYCEKCKKRVVAIQKEFEREVKCQNVLYNSALIKKEREILKKIKK